MAAIQQVRGLEILDSRGNPTVAAEVVLAIVALAKGGFMLAFGLGVLGEALYKAFHPVMPGVETMGIVGASAFAANLACFALLYRHRADNLNMSSTWLCSRNDLVANVAVLLAAVACHLLASRWPDIVVGTLIAVLFVGSALGVLGRPIRPLRTSPGPVPISAATPGNR